VDLINSAAAQRSDLSPQITALAEVAGAFQVYQTIMKGMK
jgi:hypothetical protein